MKIQHKILLLFIFTSTACADPQLRWEFRGKGSASTDFTEYGGIIYYGTSSGMVYGINISSGNLQMNYTSTAGIYSKPAIYKDYLVFGCDNKVVYAVNRTTGERIWTYLAQATVKAHPKIKDGKVYVGSTDGVMHTILLETGKKLSQYKSGYAITEPAIIENWKIFFINDGRNLICLSNVTNQPIWNITLSSQPKGGYAEFEDIIYVTTSDKKLIAIDKITGETLWNQTLNTTTYLPPTVFLDTVITADSKGMLTGYDAYFSDKKWQTQLNASLRYKPAQFDGVLYQPAGYDLFLINPLTGEIVDAYNFTTTIRSKPHPTAEGLIMAEGSIIKAYGGANDFRINSISINPTKPQTDLPFQIFINLENNGDNIITDIGLEVYIDRNTVSKTSLTLFPHSKKTHVINASSGFGTHLLEVRLDPDSKKMENNRADNEAGYIFNTLDNWPMGGKEKYRTSFYDPQDNFTLRIEKVLWRCIPQNKNHTTNDMKILWEYLNQTDDYSLNGFSINNSCYAQKSSGYKIGRTYSNWSCNVKNVTGMSETNIIRLIRDIKMYDETQYNRSIKQNKPWHTFNMTDFQVQFNCDTDSNPDFPMTDVNYVWSCRVKKYFTPTIDNITDAWNCILTSTTNHSVNDIYELKNYGSKKFEPPIPYALEDFTLKFSYDTNSKIYSSPILVDLGYDDGLEIIFGTESGSVYALNGLGEKLFETKVDGNVHSVVADDLDLDGVLEIIAATNSTLNLLNSKGDLMWSVPYGSHISTEPLIYDVDETYGKEIIVGGLDRRITAFNLFGEQIWNYEITSDIISPMTVWDVDGDGVDEIVFGSSNNIVYAVNTPPYKVWTYQTGGDILGSPTVGNTYHTSKKDLLVSSTDGKIYDIYYTSAGTEDIRRVCDELGCRRVGFSKTKLRQRWIYEVTSPITTSIALGDYDGDKQLEMVFGTVNGELSILNTTGHRLMHYTLSKPIYSDPVIADINKDGIYEVFFGSDDGFFYILNQSGLAQWKMDLGSKIRSNPAIADMDSDGYPEIAVTTLGGKFFLFSKFNKGTEKAIDYDLIETLLQNTVKALEIEDLDSEIPFPSDITFEILRANENDMLLLKRENILLGGLEDNQNLSGEMYFYSKALPNPYASFPHDGRGLGAYIVLMCIMGYYFFMVMQVPTRIEGTSKLKKA